uniref:NADH-ubiquinone oxidoreductase chain 3 n=1 Tax=Amaurobius fenestralis TaxID=680006 RepID=A0A7L7S3R4_9ARAC|nr:NADH dehydrogenase subunit 3 [Amaurobius fenestralis]
MYNMIISTFILILIIYMLFSMMFYKTKYDLESSSSYECGFDPMSVTRMSFSYRFFLISILFIIFDVEISLMLSLPYLVESSISMFIFIMFLLILIIGLLYEYYCGSLNWVSNYNNDHF